MHYTLSRWHSVCIATCDACLCAVIVIHNVLVHVAGKTGYFVDGLVSDVQKLHKGIACHSVLQLVVGCNCCNCCLCLQYTSTFALTETGTCPLSSTAQTETAYHTFVPGSGLGQLVNRTFCSPLRRGFLDHPIHADRTGLQAGFTLNS